MLQNPDQSEQQTSDEPARVRPGVASFLASLAFWLVLFTAAAGYALAALSPGYLRWQTALHEQRNNALELDRLAAEIRQLDGLVAAMQADPELAAALSAARSGTANPDLARLTAALRPGPVDAIRPAGTTRQLDRTPWETLLRQAAAAGPFRTRLMWGSATLTLLAFTFLNDAGGAILASLFFGAVGMVVGVFRRYVPPVKERQPEPPEKVSVPPLTLFCETAATPALSSDLADAKPQSREANDTVPTDNSQSSPRPRNGGEGPGVRG